MCQDYKNKKVTVAGLGLHGGGLAAANWLIKHGAKVTVTDLKSAKELADSVKKIKGKAKLVLGRHRLVDFKTADIVIQNPGMPANSEYIKTARKAGVLIENEASLFFKNCPSAIIGVTGTRGKSTTSNLIYSFLKEKYSTVRLAGQPQNPMMAILDKIKPNDLTVLELSSWQLEILGEQKISPQVAVITNVYPDHLNRYGGMKDYIAAKEMIFSSQKSNDLAVFNLDNQETKKMAALANGHRLWFSKNYFKEQNGVFVRNDNIYFRLFGQEEKLAKVSEIKLLGQHNLENVLAALAVAGIFNVAASKIKKVLRTFLGLPFRMELIANFDGIKYINDTTATTPDGTMAALKSLKKNIILIAGGDTKNIPDQKYKELAGIVAKTCKAVVLFKGKGTDQLLKFLKIKKIAVGFDKMIDAVSVAQSFAKKGDIILLSPACASFNLFINEYDRGIQFNQIIKKNKK